MSDQLTLCGWRMPREGGKGSTAGYWLVRELAGLVLWDTGRGWVLFIRKPTLNANELLPAQIWGTDWDVRPTRRLIAPLRDSFFVTRAAALAAVQARLDAQQPRDSTLGEVLA